MKIYYKLKSFPNVSETFVVSNILYAKEAGYQVKIYTNKYLGLNNSSQKKQLQRKKIKDDVIFPFRLKGNKLMKSLQLVFLLLHPRVFWFSFKYYSFFKKKEVKHKKWFDPIIELYQYRDVDKAMLHVHFNNALQPLLNLSSIGYVKNLKCIVTFHGYDAFIENKESFKKTYEKFYKNYVTYVTVNSNYLKKQVVNLGVKEDKIKVIPIGINTSFFKSAPKQLNDSSINLLTVGRLIQLKGQIYGIKVVAELIKLGYSVNYTIVGNGPDMKILNDEIKRLHLTSVVFLKGSKSQAEVKFYMKKADVFIMPSTYDNQSERREAFGVVSLEAQAMGLPVIGFNSGGFPDTVKDGKTGFLVKDRNHKQIVEKVCYLINRPEVFKKMSEMAIEHSKKFDLKYTTQSYLDLYEAV